MRPGADDRRAAGGDSTKVSSLPGGTFVPRSAALYCAHTPFKPMACKPQRVVPVLVCWAIGLAGGIMARARATRRIWTFLVIVLLSAGTIVSPLPNTPTAAAAAEPRFFAETGHYLNGRFREYWESHGGLF